MPDTAYGVPLIDSWRLSRSRSCGAAERPMRSVVVVVLGELPGHHSEMTSG
jgi:hypothetical protein